MGILGEEPAVGLGEHLVHGLLRQVDQLPEKLCRMMKNKQTQIS